MRLTVPTKVRPAHQAHYRPLGTPRATRPPKPIKAHQEVKLTALGFLMPNRPTDACNYVSADFGPLGSLRLSRPAMRIKNI